MANTITKDQVVGAAKELSQEEFTRADLAEKLGVRKPELHEALQGRPQVRAHQEAA